MTELKDCLVLPATLLVARPELVVTVTSTVMGTTGYDDGDVLHVRLGVTARDGDQVLVETDGRCTVRTLFSDDEGQAWLVAADDRVEAQPLTAGSDIRLLGVVTAVDKIAPRTPAAFCMKAVQRARSRQGCTLSDDQVDSIISTVGPEVHHGRRWYAVYRALADCHPDAAGSVADFCRRVARVLPGHAHLPDPKEVGRMAVQSFSKRVELWTPANAPASGAHYQDYVRLAELTRQQIRLITL